MDFGLDEDQQALVDAVRSIRRPFDALPMAHKRDGSWFAADLQRTLAEGGYLDAARAIGPLEAALIVTEAAQSPCVVETGASALVVPHLRVSGIEGPVALIAGDLSRAQRFLPVARSALIDTGEDVVLIAIDPAQVEPVDTIFAYPYGRFRTPPSLDSGQRLGGAAMTPLRQWWRVSLAAEIAGAAQAAVAFTVDYVQQRHVFGKPV